MDRAITVSYAEADTAREIEEFMLTYDGNDLLHDIQLSFPQASYLSFFLAVRKVYGDIGGRLASMGEKEGQLVGWLKK